MENIEFRGLTKEGRWFYGYVVKTSTGPDKRIGYSIKENIRHVNDGFINLIPEEVLTETVGQYTGLLDKNGTKIFEGDIVRVSEYHSGDHCIKEHNGIIEFNEGSFDVFSDEAEWLDALSSMTLNKYIEIIGNVHQNKNLLEDK